jgi:hypothetical protein
MGSSPGRSEERSTTELVDITKNYGSGAACPRDGCTGVIQHKTTPRTNNNNKIYKYSQCSVCGWHTLNS